MHLAVLGPLHARLSNGTDVPLAGQRVLDLVAVLATRRGRPIDAATLRELLWGEEAGAIGDSAVHTVIARVRRLLGVDAVTTTPFGYRLAESTTVDADQFAHEVAAARRMQEPRNRVDVLERALAMWRGPAFLGADDHVVAAERVRLHELRSGSVEALVDGLLLLADAGSAEQARALAGELIHDEPLRERAYVLAMRADLQLGRTADALSTFEQLRHVLRTELGVDPGEEAC
ncbi:MAG: BTAD domain-containing putative transcriptional regulator, partial [Nocardioides sp.]